VNEVELRREGNVALITLAAPDRRNAFTPDMVAELLAICAEVDGDSAIGAAVIQAKGESFCAGAHRALLAEVGYDPASEANYDALGLTYRAFARVGELGVPTVAAVRGHAVGAGVNLMLATDLRIVATDARIITGFRRIGLHPGGGHFVLLGRTGSREAAAALGLFGVEVDGRRAAEIGLAWEALREEEVEPRALELATAVSADPALARNTVQSFRLELGPPMTTWHMGLEAERAAQMWSLRRRGHKA
jgi:enoyl-CoA hydratase